MQRKLPALCGTSGRQQLKTPTIAPASAQASERFSPNGRQSTLSRRSTSIVPSSGSTSIDDVDRHLLVDRPGSGSWVLDACSRPAGSSAIACVIRRSE